MWKSEKLYFLLQYIKFGYLMLILPKNGSTNTECYGGQTVKDFAADGFSEHVHFLLFVSNYGLSCKSVWAQFSAWHSNKNLSHYITWKYKLCILIISPL